MEQEERQVSEPGVAEPQQGSVRSPRLFQVVAVMAFEGRRAGLSGDGVQWLYARLPATLDVRWWLEFEPNAGDDGIIKLDVFDRHEIRAAFAAARRETSDIPADVLEFEKILSG